MDNLKRDFNKSAATWDQDPKRVKLAGDVARSIAEAVTLTSGMDVLDFGCGTGLLTLNLQPHVRSVTGVDSSQGMLDILKAKTENLKIANVSALYKDLDRGDDLDGGFHLVTSSMTFHHVRDIGPLLGKFHDIIHPSGYIAIADLDLDYGRFHEDSTGVFHNGFDRARLRRIFSDAGFEDVSDRTAAGLIKPVSGGGSREFTIFLMTGRKRA